MGAIRSGPPEALVLAVAAQCGIRTFVETGTYEGGTARWAAAHFERVVTIEAAPPLHERAVALSSGFANIEFVLGDSREALRRVLPALPGPTAFWLDGHWSGGETAGAGDECPLLGEIEAIQSFGGAHALFIDDARLFTAAPPAPHDPDQWPALDELLLALQTTTGRYSIAILDDVLVAVPPAARGVLVSYARGLDPAPATPEPPAPPRGLVITARS